MQTTARRICLIMWVTLLGSALAARTNADWSDCPRIQLDPQQGVDRLCQNTLDGANSVPLFQAMARVGDAYVAFKGVDAKTETTATGSWEDDCYYRLADRHAPVLIVAGTAARFANLDRFGQYVGELRHTIDRHVLTVRFSDSVNKAAAISVDLQQRSLPRVNGQPIDLNPPKVYDSPYLQSEFGSGLVTIRCQDQAYVWNMIENSIGASKYALVVRGWTQDHL